MTMRIEQQIKLLLTNHQTRGERVTFTQCRTMNILIGTRILQAEHIIFDVTPLTTLLMNTNISLKFEIRPLLRYITWHQSDYPMTKTIKNNNTLIKCPN